VRTTRSAAAAIAFAALGLGAGACIVSVAGLTGGYGTDASTCTTDCGEGGPPMPDAADSGPVAQDAMPDINACRPAPTPDAGLDNDASCVSDGSVCAPSAIAALALVHWNAPGQACTDQQLADFYDQCLANQNCSTFQGVPANAACNQCLFSLSTDPTYGPLVVYVLSGGADITLSNTAGCIATLDPCNTPCATVIALQGQCLLKACQPNCPPDDAGYGGLESCIQHATCPCDEYTQAAKACWDAIVKSGSPASQCLYNSAFAASAQAAARVMCGQDAGEDAGQDAQGAGQDAG
jgi:hypothetical protein